MHIRNPLIRNMAVYAISDGVTKAMPFLVFPVVAFYLTTEEFGLVTNYQVFLSIVGVFTGLSTSSFFTVEYYRAGNNLKSTYNNIHYFNLILLIFVSLVIIIFQESFSKWTELSLKWISLALISVGFMNFIDQFLSRLRMEEKVKLFGIFNISSSAISAALTLLFVAALGLSWQGRIYSLFLTTIVGGLVALFFTVKFIGKFHKPDFLLMKSLLIFGLPLLPHNLSIWLRTGFEKLFITSSVGLASNGVYSFAVTINSIFSMFSGAFFAAFSPYVYKTLTLAESGNEDNAYRVKLGIVKKSYIFLLVYIVFLIIGFFASYLFIHIFFNEKYIESVSYLPFLLAYNFFNTCYIFVSMLVYYSKSTKYLGIITIMVALIHVFLMIFLVKRIGPAGAAISAMLVSIITLFLVYFYSNKVYPMPWLKFNELFRKSF